MELESVKFWWLSVLMKGELLSENNRWRQRPKSVNWPGVVCSRTLYNSMVVALVEQGKDVPSEAKFAMDLNSMTCTKLRRVTARWSPTSEPKKDRVMSNAIVNLPSLSDCRGAFEAVTNHRYNWPDVPNTPAAMDYSNSIEVPAEWLK